jgi:23S rRNA U2552 (ribose-2'-O)-methylase RlmE/FtsJ
MKSKFAVCAMLVWIASAVAVGQTVSVNYNHNQSFSGYHTYAWGANNANQIQNSILAQVAQQDIDTAMQSKGLQKVTEDQKPDLLITANGGMKQQTSYTAMGMRGWGGGMGTISPEQNVIGTMIVDLYDSKTQSLVWRGIAQDTLSNNGDKNQKTVQSAVSKMFKQWPKS